MCDVGFEDEGEVRVGCVDVIRVFVEGFVDDGATALSDEQDVTRRLWPLQR